MSYCRFSDDNYKSDVYVYESKDGFIIHVASTRLVGDITPMPVYEDDKKAWFAAHNQQLIDVDAAEHEALGGVFDGKTFACDTLGGLLSHLLRIGDAGYHVPAWVIPTVEEEIAAI